MGRADRWLVGQQGLGFRVGFKRRGELLHHLGGLELRARMGWRITYFVDDGQKQVAAQVPHLPDTHANPALHHR